MTLATYEVGPPRKRGEWHRGARGRGTDVDGGLDRVGDDVEQEVGGHGGEGEVAEALRRGAAQGRAPRLGPRVEWGGGCGGEVRVRQADEFSVNIGKQTTDPPIQICGTNR